MSYSDTTQGTKPLVGFIGLGMLGAKIAERILVAGYSVVVCDSNEEKTRSFVQMGATQATSPRDVADQAAVVFACLPSAEASLHVATSADGICHGQAITHYVECSTIGVQVCGDIANALQGHGIEFIDAPVSGGPHAAVTSTLSSMVASNLAAWEMIRPIVETYSSKHFYVGEKPGIGQACKLVNNAIAMSTLLVTYEATVMGAAAGVNPEMMIAAINSSSGRCGATIDKYPKSILPRSFDYGASIRIVAKDVHLFVQEARQMKAYIPLLELADRIWSDAATEGAEHDHTSVIQQYENHLGTSVAG
jgi:3-hydroxyisobutyrate dehydrogenase-like beta-hydroxyacid dehydrogenase